MISVAPGILPSLRSLAFTLYPKPLILLPYVLEGLGVIGDPGLLLPGQVLGVLVLVQEIGHLLHRPGLRLREPLLCGAFWVLATLGFFDKSTLLALLSVLLRPDSGQVVALGENLGQLSPQRRKQFRQRHFGFIFQSYNLFPALTAQQPLEITLRWGEGVAGSEARRRAAAMLELLGLGAKKNL